MFVYQKAKWFLKNRPNISWRIGHTSYSARLGCPCMAAHRRSSPSGTHVSGPTTSGKFFDCWFERSWKVCLIAIDWEIFHLTAWSIFCTLVLLVHKLQGEKTALGSKLPHILAQRLPQGALESLKIILILYNFRGNYKCDLYKCTTCVVAILEFLGGEGGAMILHDYPQTLVSTNKQVIYLYVRQWPVGVETCLHQKHLVRLFYCLVQL